MNTIRKPSKHNIAINKSIHTHSLNLLQKTKSLLLKQLLLKSVLSYILPRLRHTREPQLENTSTPIQQSLLPPAPMKPPPADNLPTRLNTVSFPTLVKAATC